MPTLKDYAKEAKKRLKNYEYSKEKPTEIHQYVNVVSEHDATEELRLRAIVEEIAASEEPVLDPMKRLVDNEYFSTLKEVEKERYIIELAAKYKRLLELYK